MSDMFDALIGEQPIDPTTLANSLRQKQALGTVAALTGISGLQKLGPQMINEAASGAQDYATLRDRTANQGLQRALQAQGLFQANQQHEDALAERAQHDRALEAQTKAGDRELIKVIDPNSPQGYKTILRSAFNPDSDNLYTAPSSGDARSAIQNDRVITAANEAGLDIHNLSLLPAGVSSGILGVGGSPGHSLFSVTGAALKNTLAPEETQAYNKIITGLAQNIASTEAGGLQSSQARVKSFDSLLLQPGDTMLTKLQSMANMRQNVEKAIEVKLASSHIPQEQKDILKAVQEQLKQDVPFSVEDVIKLQRGDNPSLSFADVINQKGLRRKSALPQTTGAMQLAPGGNPNETPANYSGPQNPYPANNPADNAPAISAGTPQSAAPTIVRTGMRGKQKVAQMSDGTIQVIQ